MKSISSYIFGAITAVAIPCTASLPGNTYESNMPDPADTDRVAEVPDSIAPDVMLLPDDVGTTSLLEGVIPPSPQAAAIARYAEYPVSHTTGIPDISVPLYEIDLGGYRLPVSISYHASGTRPDEIPGYVGSGWTLNAGGAVTRTILGKPDKPMTGSDIDLPCYDDTFLGNMIQEVQKKGGGQGTGYIASIVGLNEDHDTESDRYSFNVAGNAGVFRYSHSDRAYIILNNSNWLVEALSSGPRFRIITNNCIEYEFDEEECSGVGPSDTEPAYATAWYITAINTPYGRITFTYGSGYSITVKRTNVTATSGPRLELTEFTNGYGNTEYAYVCHSRQQVETADTYFSYQQRPLESITWDGGKVVFEYEEGHRYVTLKRLISMKVLDPSGSLRKSVSFDNTDNWPTSESSTGRRLLKKVSDSEQGIWNFEYDKTVSIPGWYTTPTPNCLAQHTDFWGYLNTSNPSARDSVFTASQAIWLQEVSEYTGWHIGTRDRTPSLPHTKAGVLTTIKFPTGGKVTYSYELNRHAGRNYGGLRVRSFTVYDSESDTGRTTTFEYQGEYRTSEEPEDLTKYLSYRQMRRNPAYGIPELGDPWPEEIRTCVTIPINPVSGSPTPVVYTDVKEKRPDGSMVRYLYDANELSDLYGVGSEYDHPSLYHQSINDWGVREPLLLSKTIYDMEGKAAYEEKYTYERKTRRKFTAGVRTVCPYYEYMVPPNEWQSVTVTPELVAKFGVLQHKPSNAYVRANLLVSRAIKDISTGISSITEYTYDGELRSMLPSSETLTGSDGISLRKEYKYAFDFDDETSKRMVEDFCMTDVPVETLRYAANSLISVSRTSYSLLNGWYYPVCSSSWSAPTSSSLQGPPATLPVRESVTSYNSKGRPLSIKVNDTDISTFTWDATGTLLRSSTAPGSLTTTYTYKPLFGLTSLTLPNGYRTTYTYDRAGPLASVADDDGIIAIYSYSIANHSSSWMTGYGNSVTTTRLLNDATDPVTTCQYHDGLGRPTTYMEGGRNTSGRYVYTSRAYDALGRESQATLPSIGTTQFAYLSFEVVKTLSNVTYKDQYACSETTYDALDRPVKVSTPGKAWNSADKGKTTRYLSNAANSVRLYSAPMTSTSLTTGTYYAANTLQGVCTVDEDGKEMTVYTDRLGRKVLERRGPESNKGQNDTYFVYNALGQLRFVLSPSYQESANLTEYAYEYRYDQHGNVVYKTIPGAGYTQYWYDRAGRLAYMQDANLRSGSLYRFFLYDKAGRQVIQGVCKSCTRDETVNFATYAGGTSGFMSTGYTLANASRIQQATLETVAYFDNYTFISGLDSHLLKSGTASAKGLQTGAVVYASDGSKSVSAIYYDAKGRVIENREITHFNTKRTTTTSYNYAGQPLKTTLTEGSVSLITENTYDNGSGLLTATDVTVNGTKQRVSAVTYDDLGRIISIKRGNDTNSGGTVSYTYNLHGQTKSIEGPGFSQTLYYADWSRAKLYNGSVCAMTWTTGTDNTLRGYKYTYNDYNWLTSAEYGEGLLLTSNKDRYSEKLTSFTRNGSVKELQRYGLTASGTYGKVDDLTVIYNGNRIYGVSDGAPAVTQNGSMDFPGGSTSKVLTYNEFGALCFDAARGITSVSYDDFGMPVRTDFKNGGSTQNVYSAAGEKIKTTHATPVNSLAGSTLMYTNIAYHGPAIYRNGSLDKVLFPGGYATVSGSTVTFHYYTQDYLGNNRAVINGSTGAIEQIVAYYPYGAVIADLGTPTTGQPYKFGGKELITANGLNEYDFGARQYYSAVPGFTSIDPLCEETTHLSPYLYCGNNPVNAIDPDGRSTWVTDMGDGKYKVVGGDLDDKDLNIYIIQKSEDGEYLVKGSSIGKSLFMTSFYNSGNSDASSGSWMTDAIIDTKDMSGKAFFEDIKDSNPPLFDDYMVNAMNGKRYDFKALGANSDNDFIHYYRGMPFDKTKEGTTIFASARDIGNIGAGYIAGVNGIPWSIVRISFDGYQTISNLSKSLITTEGISSQNPQLYGWMMGKANNMGIVQFVNFVRSIKIGERNITNGVTKLLFGH